MNIPDDKVHLLNYTPGVDYMHTPAKYGGGLEALVEVFHQLHCLVRSPHLFDLFSILLYILHLIWYAPLASFILNVKVPQYFKTNT